MDNYSFLYWLTRLDGIREYLDGLIFIGILVAALTVCARFIPMEIEEDVSEAMKRTVSRILAVAIVTAFLSGTIRVFIPSRNDMLIIYAGGKTLNYVQADTSLSKLPYQTTAIISGYMDKALRELKEEEK